MNATSLVATLLHFEVRNSITHGLQIPSLRYEKGVILNLAEAVGFEPTVPCGTLVFKTSAFSLTRPHFRI